MSRGELERQVVALSLADVSEETAMKCFLVVDRAEVLGLKGGLIAVSGFAERSRFSSSCEMALERLLPLGQPMSRRSELQTHPRKGVWKSTAP